MMNIYHYPIYVTLGKRNRGPKATTKMGVVKNILISNINVTGADAMSGIQLTGTQGYPLQNIKLQNISVEYEGGGTKEQGEKLFPELERGYPEPFLLGPNPAYGLFARHIKGLQLLNIAFTTKKQDNRPALIMSDVDGLEIDHFKVPVVAGNVMYKFTDVTDTAIDHADWLSR
jgi:hypothetical protein